MYVYTQKHFGKPICLQEDVWLPEQERHATASVEMKVVGGTFKWNYKGKREKQQGEPWE